MRYIVFIIQMMNKIFILKKGKYISGPYSLEQLQQKGLRATDKVWHDGLGDWQPASFLEQYGIAVDNADMQIKAKARSLFFWKKPVW